jgi:hypothetical protein
LPKPVPTFTPRTPLPAPKMPSVAFSHDFVKARPIWMRIAVLTLTLHAGPTHLSRGDESLPDLAAQTDVKHPGIANLGLGMADTTVDATMTTITPRHPLPILALVARTTITTITVVAGIDIDRPDQHGVNAPVNRVVTVMVTAIGT